MERNAIIPDAIVIAILTQLVVLYMVEITNPILAAQNEAMMVTIIINIL